MKQMQFTLVSGQIVSSIVEKHKSLLNNPSGKKKFKIKEKLENLKSIVSGSDFNNFIDKLIQDIDTILITPNLQDVINNNDTLYSNLSKYEKDELKEKFEEYYNYWRSNYALELFREYFGSLSTCPYCNINSIMNIDNNNDDDDKQALYTFDHFYDKATYPFLALSFYNLVPSCNSCNSSLKHEKDFSLEDNIHPFFDDFDDIAVLSPELNTNNLNTFLNPLQARKNEIIPIRVKPKAKAKTQQFKKAQNNAKVFKLEERYSVYQEIITETLHKAQAYSPDYIATLDNAFPTLFAGSQKIETLVWGISHKSEDINARPLSKLQKDLYDEIVEARKNSKFKI